MAQHPKEKAYTHTANGGKWRLYGCARRGCDRINLDFESFGTKEGKSYCLSHIPLRSRWRLWKQEPAVKLPSLLLYPLFKRLAHRRILSAHFRNGWAHVTLRSFDG